MIIDIGKSYDCLPFATHHRALHLAGYSEKVGFNGRLMSFQRKTLATGLQKTAEKANGTAVSHR